MNVAAPRTHGTILLATHCRFSADEHNRRELPAKLSSSLQLCATPRTFPRNAMYVILCVHTEYYPHAHS